MALLTLIARASDGLALSASIQDEESGRNISDYQAQAKQIFRKLSPQSPTKCSIESNQLVFHYVIEEGICYLALCEHSYPPQLAFSYLENIHRDFSEQHGQDVHRAQRPYHFIEFGVEINRIKRGYVETQSRRASSSKLRGLNSELQGVQKIMFENIDAALQRGELVSALSDKAQKLSISSQRYRKEARYLNLRASLMAKIVVVVVVLFFLIFLRYWLF
ncbi:Vesicle-trafficking protein SEC22b [Geodia barretti]|uniref:Vesicle-trafficking protein SEC22b n=1 Tax=Geodia barretti TaxID=519541 RepID=A0AA35WQQ2_GEOBA|nr:Vesicle-trafficking protein SEC22b [Geodia barretti]